MARCWPLAGCQSPLQSGGTPPCETGTAAAALQGQQHEAPSMRHPAPCQPCGDPLVKFFLMMQEGSAHRASLSSRPTLAHSLRMAA